MSGGQPDGEVGDHRLDHGHAEGCSGRRTCWWAHWATAEIHLKAKPMAASRAQHTVAVTTIDLQIDLAARGGGEHRDGDGRQHELFTTKPSTITWTPNAAFINKYLLGGQEAAARCREHAGQEGGRKSAPNTPTGLRRSGIALAAAGRADHDTDRKLAAPASR